MGKRLFVVDDDYELRSLIQELLEEEADEGEIVIARVDTFDHLDHQ